VINTQPRRPDLARQLAECVKSGSVEFYNGFLLAFGVRAAIGVLTRVLEVSRRRPSKLLSFTSLLGEKHVVFRVEAIRLGLFIGSFSGIYRTLSELFRIVRERTNPKEEQGSTRHQVQVFAAGCLAAGVAISFLTEDTRRNLTLYAIARVFQSLCYKLEELGYWKKMLTLKIGSQTLDGHQWLKRYYDALVFIITSAQVMYCYVMRPEVLPESYWRFIVRMGPIPAPMLKAVRHAADRNYPIPMDKLKLPSANALSSSAKIVPCSVLHPNMSCGGFCAGAIDDTIRKSWMMYLYLNVFSYLISFRSLIRSPLYTIFRILLSTARSALFLGTFVGSYQSVICVQRKIVRSDHRAIYWLAGVVSSLAIFLEKKSRREELGLYVVPRAIDSLWLLSGARGIPKGEILLYAVSIGCLVHCYEFSPSCLSSLIGSIFKRVIPKANKPNHQPDKLSDNQPS